MIQRLRVLKQAGADVAAAREAVTRALRRPATYPSALREALWVGVNIALYPVGLISEAIDPDPPPSYGGRFSPDLPLGYLDPEAAATPIVLLHGYFHNRSAFVVMRRALRRRGFRTIDTFNYNVIGQDIPEIAEALSEHIDELREATGSHSVHLIGHSLGGLVARYYVQMLGGHDAVHTCVTLGTPHRGTYAAFVARGRAGHQLRPGSNLLRDLARTAWPMPVRFLSYYTNLDGLVIPASSAKLIEPALRAENILIKDHGHLSLLISRPLLRSIADRLSSLEGEWLSSLEGEYSATRTVRATVSALTLERRAHGVEGA